MIYVLLCAAGYLLGSIPFGLYVGKLWGKIDVREHGSGNTGVSNVLRSVGPIPAALVLLLDAGKGAAAVLAAEAFVDDPSWWLAVGVCSIIGHNWPIFLGFKGGRGIATSAGVLVTLVPLAALLLLVIWTATLAISRYISLASVLAAIALPIILGVLQLPWTYLVFGLVMSAFALFRHRPNIKRLLAGKEYKLGEKARKINEDGG